MIWVIHYNTSPNVTTKEQTGELMAEFARRGEMAGTIGHWSYPGGGGVVVVDEDDPNVVYETAIAYGQWLDFDIKAAIPVTDAVGAIGAWLSS